MIKLTINDKEVELEKPITVLEAAKKVGIEIPTLCWCEGLSPLGGCRLCLVEVEGIPRLQTACTLMVSDGMIVKTDTPKVKAARRAILEFLLINHPLDCPYCDKAGECELQDLVFKYGPERGRFSEDKKESIEVIADPLIVRNTQRCVLCGRCVRMCNEVQGASAIAIINRGGDSLVEPFAGDKYECEYCGNCISVCPVGAIMSRLHRYKYRSWFITKEVETICGYCGVGCSLVVQSRDNSIVRTIPKKGVGVNKGLLCVRGRFGYDFVNSNERLTTAYLRKNGELKPVTMEEALKFVTEKIKEIKESSGVNSIGAISSSRCSNEDNYMLQRLFRFTIGTNNISSNASFYYAPAVRYLESILGYGATANLISDIANADGVFVIGGDPTAINPILGLQIRACYRKGGKVVVIGAAGGLKRFISQHIKCDPLSEETVLSVLVKGICKEKEFYKENNKLKEKIEKLKESSLKELEIAGVTKNEIDELIKTLTKIKNWVIIIGPQVIQMIRASKRLFLIAVISYLTKGKIFLLADKPNYQGVLDMGCMPDVLPGGVSIHDDKIKEKYEKVIGKKIPQNKGLTLFEMIEHAEKGKLKALYIMGENLVCNLPGRKKVENALKKLELLIVQDIYMTETAKIADVVLPAAGWSEKDGTFTNLERRIQRLKAAKKQDGAIEDWKILSFIMKKFGEEKEFTNLENVWEEITHVSELHKEIDFKNIDTEGLCWPYNNDLMNNLSESEVFVEGLEDIISNEKKEEFLLLQDRPLYHCGSLSKKSNALLSILKEAYLLISPYDAERLGIKDNDKVKISSPIDSLEIKVKLSDDVHKGTVRLMNTFSDFGKLVEYKVDPVLGCMCIVNNNVKLFKV